MKPRDYQELIIQHIMDVKRGNVHVPMGLGKTFAVLTALDRLDMIGEDVYPALIIAPLRVATYSWPDEVAKSGLPVNIICVKGNVRQREDLLDQKADIYTINYENTPWLVEHIGEKWPFKTIVCDESTALKSFRIRQGSSRAKALYKVAFKSDRLVNLTGTPAPNGLKDLWGPQFFVDKGQSLGKNYSLFAGTWFKRDYSGFNITPMPNAFEDITKAIGPTTIALETKDWFPVDLPIVSDIVVGLPSSARVQYDQMTKDLATSTDFAEINALSAATKTSKLLQITSGAVYDEDRKAHHIHDAKLEALESIISELGGENLIVVYQFKHELGRLKAKFKQGVDVYDKNWLQKWNAGKVPLLFLHPASAGHGLSLQLGGRAIAFMSLTWASDLYRQVIERIGPVRQKQAGLDRSVFVYHILAENTIDLDVLDRLKGKISVEEALRSALARRG